MPGTLTDFTYYYKWNCTGCHTLNESDDNVLFKKATCRECGKVQVVNSCTLANWNE